MLKNVESNPVVKITLETMIQNKSFLQKDILLAQEKNQEKLAKYVAMRKNFQFKTAAEAIKHMPHVAKNLKDITMIKQSKELKQLMEFKEIPRQEEC
jgi:hypothetical protein